MFADALKAAVHTGKIMAHQTSINGYPYPCMDYMAPDGDWDVHDGLDRLLYRIANAR